MLPHDAAFQILANGPISATTPPCSSSVGPIDEFAEEPVSCAIVRDRSNVALIQCLDALLYDEERLAQVAKQSYRHQLGFMKFVLLTTEDGGSVRLHHWDESDAKPEDVHSHCAHFQSRVVLGRLSESSYALVVGESHCLYRYRFDELAGQSVAAACGVASPMLRGRRLLNGGDIYRKSASDLHNVSEAEIGTITVSTWGRRHREALVLKPCGTSTESCVASAGMTISAARVALQDIRKRLARQ